MPDDRTHEAIVDRRASIVERAVGIDYAAFERGRLSFDYEGLMASVGYELDEIRRIQGSTKVGETPLLELENLTRLVRAVAPPGKGARILVKDEAANPSGSFKARRAALAVHEARRLGYAGVIAATSGNYGAAVASQAAMQGVACIILQEVFDSAGRGQPEILEKGRACEAYGAEVWQLHRRPRVFSTMLQLLDETGYYSASLYTPQAVAGIETLGWEIARGRAGTVRAPAGRGRRHPRGGWERRRDGARAAGRRVRRDDRDRGERRPAGPPHGLDADFNRKSFTTGHTGFGIPFLTNPDRVDVPRSAARALRYLDRYVTVTQGEVFYVTEALAQLEGLERGPAGNTSLAAAFVVAQELDEDAIVVVQETEYTGAGKHPTAQLTFARERRHRGSARASERERPGPRDRDPAEPRSALDHGVGSRGDQAVVPETSGGGAAGRACSATRISSFSRPRCAHRSTEVHRPARRRRGRRRRRWAANVSIGAGSAPFGPSVGSRAASSQTRPVSRAG